MNDIESRLRATFNEHAAQAPAGDELAQRILAEVEAPARVLRPRRGWSTWTMPLLAAGAVAAVVATVVAVSQVRHTAAPQPPAVSHLRTPSPSPSPSVTRTNGQHATIIAPAPAASTVHVSRPGNVGVSHFMAFSSTFVGLQDGWVLGSADCLTPGAPTNNDGTCPAMLRTTDGGQTWASMPSPRGTTPGLACAKLCIDSIRFATDRIGYAYSATTIEMTTDGGQTWTVGTGGALALETLSGNVVRLEQVPGCDTATCRVRVLTASIGSSHWTVVKTLPAPVDEAAFGNHVRLARVGSRAYLLTWTGPAGGQGAATNTDATLYTSADDGQSWSTRRDPCATTGGRLPLGAIALSSALDGSVQVLCTDGAETSARYLVLTSTDGGAHFSASADLPFGEQVNDGSFAAPSKRVLVVPALDGLERSDDAGHSWQLVIRLSVADSNDRGQPGFEDGSTGRWLSASGRTIWTTHDAGRTWTPFDFS